jgi:hypothetical protein
MLILQVVRLIGIVRGDISLTLTKIKLTIHNLTFQFITAQTPSATKVTKR